MLRKITLALVAAASLGAVALAPTAASAHWRGGFFGHHHHHHWGPGFGLLGGGYGGGLGGFGGFGDPGCYQLRPVPTLFGPRLRTVNVCGY